MEVRHLQSPDSRLENRVRNEERDGKNGRNTCGRGRGRLQKVDGTRSQSDVEISLTKTLMYHGEASATQGVREGGSGRRTSLL